MNEYYITFRKKEIVALGTSAVYYPKMWQFYKYNIDTKYLFKRTIRQKRLVIFKDSAKLYTISRT